ncbi:MAG: ABC transporter permease [Gammaproteobacteria bacterium]|nr:ABC transporter permease [Gammaproteobacteria bacterium]
MKQNISWERVLACVYKEVKHIQRDWSIVLVALVLPTLLMILFGQALNLDPGHMKMLIVYPDNASPVQSQLNPYEFSSSFANIDVESLDHSINSLKSGHSRSFVLLQDNKQINVICDGSDPNTANMLSNTILGVYRNDLSQRRLESGQPMIKNISVSQRSFYNEANLTQWMLVPGSIAVIMTLVSTLLTALVIAKEWERGSIESLFTTELQPVELFLGKWIPYCALALSVLLLCFIIAHFCYCVPMRSSPITLLFVTIFFLYATLNLGLWISASLKDQFLCAQVALMSAYMPSFMLSGFLFEIRSMPLFTQYLSALVPARYFVPPLQTCFLVGGSWIYYLPYCCILLLLGTFFGWRAIQALSLRMSK